MKLSRLIVPAATVLIALSACQTGEPPKKPSTTHSRYGYGATPTPTPDATAYATPTPEPTPDPAVQPQDPSGMTTGAAANNAVPKPSATPAPQTAVTQRDVPYGTPVPGKPGYVTSPHSPYSGYVDVRGFPPGTEVKCPYSGKIFLVP